jgi:hypothetical protein
MNSAYDKTALNDLSAFTRDYNIVASFQFDMIQKRTYLGQKLGYCRFCRESYPKVHFNDAHALPQFIGNKYLRSHYECEKCNELFSRTIENEMANFMKLLHTTYGVKGESKIPTYKNNGVRYSNSPEIKIDNVDNTFSSGNLTGKNSSLTLLTDKFVPISVYKCLVKMALSILPEIEIPFLLDTFDWIREESQCSSKFELNSLLGIFSQIKNNHLFPHISAVLFKKKNELSSPSPSFIFRLSYSKFAFQIYLPLCKLDTTNSFSVQNFKYCPHLIDITTSLGSSENEYVDFASNEKCELQTIIEITNLDK